MSAEKDPAIKLFGRNIPVPECQIPGVPEVMDECREAEKTEVNLPAEKSCKEDIPSDLVEGEENNYQNHIQENEAKGNHKPEEAQGAESDASGKEKVLKKPDKILPCPRCNSLDTKFCYFNNYNVNQPRHFCKNCQRYWTAGGTMRNVPVGAGRRKNKHSSSQFHQVVAPPDAVLVTQADSFNSASHQRFSCIGLSRSSRHVKGVGKVLKLGKDAPLCESMATVLNLQDQKKSFEMGSVAVVDNGEEPSSSNSSVTAATFQEIELPEKETEHVGLLGNYNAFTPTHPLQCYPAPPLAYPWNPGWNVMALGPNSNNQSPIHTGSPPNPNPTHTGSPPMVAVPGFCTPSITIPFVPASYWGCMPSWDARNMNIQLVGSAGCLSPSSSTSNSGCSGYNSPTLGKHSRELTLQAEEKTEQCLWVPKTLRIDDPDEAAKSSIWATLGIKLDKNESIRKGGIFKAFQPKSKTGAHASDADQVLQANPAALSRSQSFQEST